MRHPLIKPDTVEQRLYQLNLAGKALEGSSLVVLPTGLGKTIIALFVIASRLQRFGGKALVLSPTKPLVEQHAAFFKRVMALPEEEVLTFTGSISPAEREELWARGKLIVSTPQVIENDILTKRISLEDVSHVTFDEAHRAVGNYAYTFIAEKYFETAKNPHVLAITASPGSSDEKIAEVCEALHIENVAVKTEKDRDVQPYVQEKEIEWEKVSLPPEMKEIRDLLEKIMDDRIGKLGELGFPAAARQNMSKKDLIALQKKLQSELRGEGDSAVFTALSVLAEMMKLNHGIELVETQGMLSLQKYLEKLEQEACAKGGTKAAKRLMEDLYMRKALHRLKENGNGVEHPKLGLAQKIVSVQLEKSPESRAIVFTNYRDTAEMVTDALSEIPGIFPVRFVGQSSKYKDKGLTQKKQVEIIEKFKEGEYNVLVATSVAEEGLDIPSTDLVLFYEPIPSEIRSIQRKGRTGRQHKGRVVVLVTKGTRDEAYYWSSKNKEKKMLNSMHGLESALGPKKGSGLSAFENGTEAGTERGPEKQKTLGEFEFPCETGGETLRVVVDHRETKSGVAKFLDRLGVELSFKTLEVGDYVVSDRIAVERKRTDDFASSLIDGKRNLFAQLSDLARAYTKPFLIIEGGDLFTARQINPNSIYGTLASIAIDFGVSILYSRDEEETAAILKVLAKREQVENKREVNPHGKKSASTLAEQQEYLVSSISDIGPKAARNLLLHFGSVEAIMKADIEELKKVKLIGPKTAAKIREIVASPYKG
ncbi:DEAD/DEAH box helicase [Methanosarcina sp. KYL-1]|nr:DEAD/DEAH box helicase [Methanosarcina sp. KYL-1]